jgi:hypothetical protein
LALKKPKSVKQILNSQNSGLQELLHHTQRLNTLNKQLSHLLPLPLALHCTAAAVEQETLVLMVDSPAWATRLRLQSPNLIKALKDFQIKSVAVKIQPLQKAPETTPRARPKMSCDTANLLNYLAETTSDLKLKQALQRLARHTSK